MEAIDECLIFIFYCLDFLRLLQTVADSIYTLRRDETRQFRHIVVSVNRALHIIIIIIMNSSSSSSSSSIPDTATLDALT